MSSFALLADTCGLSIKINFLTSTSKTDDAEYKYAHRFNGQLYPPNVLEIRREILNMSPPDIHKCL